MAYKPRFAHQVFEYSITQQFCTSQYTTSDVQILAAPLPEKREGIQWSHKLWLFSHPFVPAFSQYQQTFSSYLRY
jgi:hypothetical protein